MKKEMFTIGGLLILLLACAVLQFIAGDVECAKFTINVMTALGVISAVMFATYGERIKAIISPVRLKIEPVLNHDNFKNKTESRGRGIEDVVTFHLMVRNLNSSRPAKNCSVKLVKLLDEGPNGKFLEKFRFAVPRQMVWAPSENDPTERTIYDYEVFDLGNLFLIDGEFHIRFHSKQGGTFDPLCKLGARRQYVFKVVAEGSEKPQEFSVNIRPQRVMPTAEWQFDFTLDIEVV